MLMKGRGVELRPKGEPLPPRGQKFWTMSKECKDKIERIRRLSNRPIPLLV